MKNKFLYLACFFALALTWSCKKTGNYPGGVLSPYIAIFDIREIHKGQDVTLTQENMLGAERSPVW